MEDNSIEAKVTCLSVLTGVLFKKKKNYKEVVLHSWEISYVI